MNTNNYHKVRDITLIGKAVAATATAATGIITLVKAVKGIGANHKPKATTNEAKVQETETEDVKEEETETDTQEETE